MPLSKELKERRVQEGLCEQCGERAKNGTTRKCVECKLNNKSGRARGKERKTAQGLCIMEGCSNTSKEGCLMCQACINKSSAGTSKAYAKKKKAGFCPYCPEGTPCVEDRKACQKHLDLISTSGNDSYRKCKEAGLCYFCAHPKAPALPGTAYCVADKARGLRRSKQQNARRRKLVLDYYGHKCACCGLTLEIALQIDHMHGGGTKHLKEIGQSGLYRWLINNKFPTGYQTLCALCNWMKRHHGACPHTLMPIEAQELVWKHHAELARILKSVT